MDRVDLTASMMALHGELDDRLFRHQRALLDRAYGEATLRLAEFESALLAHIADEEALVLPRYAALGGDQTGAPVRLFRGEHDNLRRFAAEFGSRLAELRAAADDRKLLELLDRQATFKNLMLHHDLRERNVLYPHLATRLPQVEQAAILRSRSWAG